MNVIRIRLTSNRARNARAVNHKRVHDTRKSLFSLVCRPHRAGEHGILTGLSAEQLAGNALMYIPRGMPALFNATAANR